MVNELLVSEWVSRVGVDSVVLGWVWYLSIVELAGWLAGWQLSLRDATCHSVPILFLAGVVCASMLLLPRLALLLLRVPPASPPAQLALA